MNTAAVPTDLGLISLLHAVRSGRTARSELERALSLPESRKKALRLQWVSALEEATLQLRPKVRADTMAFTEPVAAWFDRGLSDLVTRFVMQMAQLTVSGEQMLRLLAAAREGREAEETLATLVRTQLRQGAAQFGNLLSPHHSHSDLVQEAVTELLEWAVREFRGTTESEFWAVAQQRLEWMALEEGRARRRRPAPEPLCEEPDLEDRSSPSASSESLSEREQSEKIEACIDRWPELDRLLFRLHHSEGLSYPELAELLGGGESKDAVGHRIRALRAKLHSHLSEE